MADALISGLVKELLGRLTSAAIQEYGLLRRLKNDLLTLEDDFNQIQAVLEDAEEKHTREKAVELWLKCLRSESLIMENLLDEVSSEAMLRQLGMKHTLRAFFSPDHNPLMFRSRIAHKVKAIRRRFADISAKRLELNLSPGSVTSSVVHGGIISTTGGIPNRETSSLIHSSTIFGRNEELKMVTEKICNTNIGKKEDTDILVYAIWEVIFVPQDLVYLPPLCITDLYSQLYNLYIMVDE